MNIDRVEDAKDMYAFLIELDLKQGKARREAAIAAVFQFTGVDLNLYRVWTSTPYQFTPRFRDPKLLKSIFPLNVSAFLPHDPADEIDKPDLFIPLHQRDETAGWGLKEKNDSLWNAYNDLRIKRTVENLGDQLAESTNRSRSIAIARRSVQRVQHKYPNLSKGPQLALDFSDRMQKPSDKLQ